VNTFGPEAVKQVIAEPKSNHLAAFQLGKSVEGDSRLREGRSQLSKGLRNT